MRWIAFAVSGVVACGSTGKHSQPSSEGSAGFAQGGTRAGFAGTGAGGKSAAGGRVGSGGAAQAGTTQAAAGMAGEVSVPPATGKLGKWENVTSPDMDPALFTGASGFGVGNIVQHPHRPTDMYVGGYGSLWKSVDYGFTWAEVPSNPKPAYQALGHVLAIAGDAATTLVWLANGSGDEKVYRSTNGGIDFTLTGA